MTEDEARTKWCPFVRIAVSSKDAPARNRHPNGTFLECTCIASECMAWRVKHIVSDVLHDGEGKTTTYASGEAGGYCGLAK